LWMSVSNYVFSSNSPSIPVALASVLSCFLKESSSSKNLVRTPR
jgi:hypothetical protein